MKVRRLLVTMGLALALAVGLSTSALAANLPYDGSDPNSTGCSGSAWTPFFINVADGTLELRFSNGCSTAWARFTCLVGGCTNYNIFVQRQQDGKAYSNGVSWPSSTPRNAILYTLQVGDPGGWSAIACYNHNGGAWQCTGAY